MNFTVYLYVVQCQLSMHIKTFNTCRESLKSQNLYFVTEHAYVCHSHQNKTNSPACISFPNVYIFLPALYLTKELLVVQSFPFLPCHHFQSKWLADTVRKDLIGFLDWFSINAFFLHLFPVVVDQKSVVSGAIYAFTYSVIDITHLPCNSLKSH